MKLSDDLFISDQHPESKRWVIVEDDGQAAWMYLSEPDSHRPVSDCWLYNRVPTPPQFEHREGAPVVPATHAYDGATIVTPLPDSVRLLWGDSGESVAVLFASELMGFIIEGESRGFSRFLRESGPFGHVLDLDLFRSTFDRPHLAPTSPLQATPLTRRA